MSIQLTEEDYTIEAYINRRTDGRYDEVIQPEGRWKIFSALSELRTSLYNWYDFKTGATVLEVNAGYGAVTGAFLRKGLQVTAVEPEEFKANCLKRRFTECHNLTVKNCNVDKFIEQSEPETFDYIILTDVLRGSEPKASENLLRKLRSILRQSGKLLIATPNKYGLRYLCGNGDAEGRAPFAGLDAPAAFFSRDDLVNTVKNAGFDYYKFYYPLPTHTITQAIYSDEHLPGTNIGERISFYGDRKDEELVADERKLYRDVIANGCFPFHANSFLLECGRENNLSDITYATVTTDRGFESASSTTIHGDTVTKTCIYPEGRESIARIFQSGIELKARGILTVEQKKGDDSSLEMSYIDAPTLSDMLRSIAEAGDRGKFLQIFDALSEQILRSSDISETNEFPGAGISVDYGPILSISYIDMIPLNCFYRDGQFIFFDQEFVRYNWPANYVMFRALRYTYGSIPCAQSLLPLEELQSRYGISTEMWDQYEAEEVRFVNENRRYDLYQCFYYKTVWNEDQILRNRLRLAQSDMIREKNAREEPLSDNSSNIKVTWASSETASSADLSIQQEENIYTSPELKAVWDVEFDLLQRFKDICEEHHLTYYLWAGSMLGAVRHEGIIPWDDDIDVAMPRKDFERFKQICKASLSAPYYLQSDDDHTVFMGGKLRLRNSNTTGFEFREARYGGNWGIWIDILALDYVYRDEQKKKRQLNRIGKAVQTCRHEAKIKHAVSGWRINCFNRAVTACQESEAGSWGIFTAAFKAEEARIYDLSLFRKQMLVKYQDMLMPVPSKYDTILRMQYEDYTKLLPPEERKPSHLGIFKPDVPFSVYQKRIMNAFRYDSSEYLVLFGAGNMIKSFMELHGKKHKPVFIVDNNPAKWGLEYKGITIYSPEKLKEFPCDQLHIIICNNYYKQIAEQLEGMGIHEYYLYVETLTNLSNVLFPGYSADGNLVVDDNNEEAIDFYGYGVGKKIDNATGRVVPSDNKYMTSDKVWHAYPGSRLILKNKHYHYAVATYDEKPDGTLIYTYCYAPDMNWASYNHDMVERGFIGRDYVFEDERFFRVMLTRLDGGDIPREAENEGILKFVSPKGSSGIPGVYYHDEINQTCTEIARERENVAAPLTIALIADTHYAPGTTWENSLCNIKAVHDRIHFDNIVHLGDLTDGMGSKLLTKHYADHVMNGLRQMGIPTYLTLGNHDTNYFRGNPEAYSLPEQFDAYYSGKDPTDTVRSGADLWYYVDRYPQKLRMIFLGSFDVSEKDRYGFWEEEIAWVEKTLKQTPDDWCAIVFSHVPLLPEMHYWTKAIRNSNKLLTLLEEFNGTGNRMLGYIHGHNHCDQIETKHGFPIISTGANKLEYFTYYKPEGSITYKRIPGTASEDLWDTLVIDTENRKLKFIRFGAGDNRFIQPEVSMQ